MLDDSKSLDTQVKFVNACPIYTEEMTKEYLAQQHEAVIKQDSGLMKTGWKNSLNFKDKYDQCSLAFEEMITQYTDMTDGYLGRKSIAEYRTALTPWESRSVYSTSYRVGPRQRAPERDNVDDTLKERSVKPATTEWASLVVFDLKKDGTLRFCVYSRRSNAITVRDTYPVPRMDESIDSLGQAKIF